MTKKEFKAFVNEALEDGAVWFRTNEEDQEPGGILYVEDDELVFNFIDGCEDFRYCPEDYDDTKSLVDEMWQEQSPKKWEQIDEEEYDEVEEEYFNMLGDMNYWIIDVSAGCPWGYSFAVKAKFDDDIDEWYYRDMVIKGARKAGLFNNENDWCGCACHLIGYDALVDLEDWKDKAVEIEI